MRVIPDFHTHDPATERPALVSLPPGRIAAAPLASVQLHPWELKEDFAGLPEEFRRAAVSAAALGETGLDRLKGPSFPVQQMAFEAVVCLAEKLHKPVVIHCVHAWCEVEQMKRRHPAVKMLIHGFTGGPGRLTALRETGFFLSLGMRALHNAQLVDFLKKDGWRRLGLESDDDPAGLAPVIAAYRTALECSEAALAAWTEPNFEAFLR